MQHPIFEEFKYYGFNSWCFNSAWIFFSPPFTVFFWTFQLNVCPHTCAKYPRSLFLSWDLYILWTTKDAKPVVGPYQIFWNGHWMSRVGIFQRFDHCFTRSLSCKQWLSPGLIQHSYPSERHSGLLYTHCHWRQETRILLPSPLPCSHWRVSQLPWLWSPLLFMVGLKMPCLSRSTKLIQMIL